MSRGLFRVVSFEELSEISNDGCDENVEESKSTRLSITKMEEEVECIIQTTELNIKTATEEFRQLQVAIENKHHDVDYEFITKIASNSKEQLTLLTQNRIDLMDILNRIGQMKQSVEMIVSGYKQAAQTQCRDRKFAIHEQQLKFLRKAIALNDQQLELCTLAENVVHLNLKGQDLYKKCLEKMST